MSDLSEKLRIAEFRVDGLCEIRSLVDIQAEDEGLWFIAQTAPEAYLQQELRRLHRLVERNTRWWIPEAPA